LRHSTNYTDTLILPSPDTRAVAAEPPIRQGTIAARQFDMLARPYAWTSDDILSGIAADRADLPEADRAAFRDRFLAKGQPCLRTSPLVKSHGWAIHHDADGKVALIDPAGPDFVRLLEDDSVTKIAGMRSTRG